MKPSLKQNVLEYCLFVLPVFVFLIAFEFIPFVNGIVYSFTDWNGISQTYNIIGFDNYIEALKPGSAFWSYLLISIRFMLIIVPITNVIALLLANLLNNPKLKSSGFARVVVFSPSVVSAVVIAFLWQYVFSTCFAKLGDIFGLEILHASWLGDPEMAFWSIVLVSVWGGIGFLMVIYLAGLQSIDSSVLEASVIDGASPLQQLIRIKLPLIMGSVTVCVFLSLSGNLRMFDLPFLLTGGGPAEATTTPAINIYVEAFSRHSYGIATARSIVLFVFVLILTMLQVSFTKSKEIQQ
ncbi:MAG: sugar ABC transporter permease [Clostridiales bacterium]|nr:sugar ABC transporter permease [Clostridiales bacterium]